MTLDQFLALASHPVVAIVAVFLGAPVVALVVGLQGRSLGLDKLPIPGLSRFRFSGLLSALAGWAALVVGLDLALDAPPALDYLAMGSVRALLAAGVLALGCVGHQGLMDLASESRDLAQRRNLEALKPVALLGGLALAGLVLANAGFFLSLLAVLLGAGVWLIDPERRGRAIAMLRDARASSRRGSTGPSLASPGTTACESIPTTTRTMGTS